MREKFVTVFDEILATNRDGKIRNLLITDDNDEFLDGAVCTLRSWAVENNMNLIELDERDSSWFPEIQSRELFCKLNSPNTVLLIKNYTTARYLCGYNSIAGKFLKYAAMHRTCVCGSGLESYEKLPNLMFVVAVNDLSEMTWRKDEYMTFSVIHQDDTKKVWTNKKITLISSKMHPVLSQENKVKFWVSDDETTLCFGAEQAFRDLGRPLRRLTANDKSEIIHTYIENNLPEFNERVVCLIIRTRNLGEDDCFLIDGSRLRKSFPNLGTICCRCNIQLVDVDDNICILDPFEIGEMSFNLAQDEDIDMANAFVRDLWALDTKWARFFYEVAKDYYRKTEDDAKVDSDGAVNTCTGMDHLFHIYFFGWYHLGDDVSDKDGKVYAKKHKDFDKALELIPLRFRNCSVDEAANKLYYDTRCLREESETAYIQFEQVLTEVEKICPGVLAIMKGNGWIT